MKFDIITIFPEIFDSYLNESILKRAQKKKFIKIKIHNLRDFAGDKHRKARPTGKWSYGRVDDRPFGGGPGMVFKIEPIMKAVGSILRGKRKEERGKKKTKVILFSATGKQFDNKMAADFAKKTDQLIFICGRYEGVDERLESVLKNLKLKTEKLSIGPYVLTGGELPAMVVIDSISRQIQGVLGKEESIEEKRLGAGVPVYTRPEVFEYNPDVLWSRGSDRKRRRGKSYKVPKILLSGDHKKIEEWRARQRKGGGVL